MPKPRSSNRLSRRKTAWLASSSPTESNSGGTSSQPQRGPGAPLLISQRSRRGEAGAINQPAIAIGMRIHHRRIAGDQIRRQQAGAGANAETVAAEAGCQEEAGQAVDGGDHRLGI